MYDRWDADGLRGHSKTIFDALDDLVTEIAAKVLLHQGTDITNFLQQIVSLINNSFLMEVVNKDIQYMETKHFFFIFFWVSSGMKHLFHGLWRQNGAGLDFFHQWKNTLELEWYPLLHIP